MKKSIKENLPWIAPTGAIFLSAILLFAAGGLKGSDETQVIPRDQIPIADLLDEAIKQDRLASFSEDTQIPENTNAGASGGLDGQNVLDGLKRVIDEQDTAEVTRNEPLPVLEVPVAKVAQPEPETQVVASTSSVGGESAADFFANAQANLIADDSCEDDLKVLANTTRIYFPAGGVTAEEAGLIKARALGYLVRSCPQFTLQVQGHSDPSGNSLVNLELSKQRAQAVMSRLATSGIDTSDFIAVGLGDKHPSNVSGPKGDAYYDRRVEFAVIKNVQTASAAGFASPWTSTPTACVSQLEEKVAQTRLFYATRAISVSPSELEGVYELAQAVTECNGARLRVIGHHTDQLGARESFDTGRLRALVLMGSLVSAGYDSGQILIGAPSFSVAVPGQPGLPKSRVDFQIIVD